MRTLFRENFLKGGQGSVIRPSSVLFLVCRKMRNRLQPNGKSSAVVVVVFLGVFGACQLWILCLCRTVSGGVLICSDRNDKY